MFHILKRTEGPNWLVAGLGNPEAKYDRTRHNVGFRALDLAARRWDIRVNRFKFKAIYGLGTVRGEKVLLLKPQTYMNLSGEAVREAAAFYKIPPQRVLILFDDVSLPVGALRVRAKGSAGGHNGIKSIIGELKTEEFPRVKIGVGEKPRPEMDLADWVLSGFTAEEEKALAPALERAGLAAEECLSRGPEAAMNLYNGR